MTLRQVPLAPRPRCRGPIDFRCKKFCWRAHCRTGDRRQSNTKSDYIGFASTVLSYKESRNPVVGSYEDRRALRPSVARPDLNLLQAAWSVAHSGVTQLRGGFGIGGYEPPNPPPFRGGLDGGGVGQGAPCHRSSSIDPAPHSPRPRRGPDHWQSPPRSRSHPRP